MIDPAQFRERLREWYALQKERDPSLTLGKLERLTGISKGFWSVWMSGNATRKSQEAPSRQQWRQLQLALGDMWNSAFVDMLALVPRLTLVNRECPVCGGKFRSRRNQVYDSPFCRFVAQWRRCRDRQQGQEAGKLGG